MPAAHAHHCTHDEQQPREPEEHFADSRQAIEERQAKAATQQQVRPSDTSRARALHCLAAQQRARSSDAARAQVLQRFAADRAGLATIVPAAATRPMGRTARAEPTRPSGWTPDDTMATTNPRTVRRGQALPRACGSLYKNSPGGRAGCRGCCAPGRTPSQDQACKAPGLSHTLHVGAV